MSVMKKLSNIPPRVALIVALLIAVGASAAVLIYKKVEPQTQADSSEPLAARVDETDGSVGIDHTLDGDTNTAQPAAGQTAQPTQVDQSTEDWAEATKNTPVSVGDRIYVRDESHCGIAFDGRNYARLDSGAYMDVLSLTPERTQVALRDGSGMFDIGDLGSGQLFEVATPCGAVDMTEPGLYQIGFGDDGSALVTVLRGVAQVVGLGGTGRITQGQVLTLAAAATDQAYVSDVAPDYAGQLVNSYYGYRYPGKYDNRYTTYDSYIASPDYDPYRDSASYHYVPDYEDIAGIEDLDGSGRWENIPDYGECWTPNVDQGWAPYRQGYWVNDGPVGLSWVSNESWGWAPYHYGRWTAANGRWYWVPRETSARPVYAPALVAFVPLRNADEVAWVPLGPKDPYVPCYYDSSFRPHYLQSSREIESRTTVFNLNVPGAVMAVQVVNFNRRITPEMAIPVDRGAFSGVRPTYNPYAIQAVRREAARRRAPDGVPGFRVPDNVERRLASRQVVTSSQPVLPSVIPAREMNRIARVREVSKQETKHDLKMNRTGQKITPNTAAAQGAAGQPPPSYAEQAQIQKLQARAARGNQQAQAKLNQMKAQQQQQQAQQQRKQEKQQRNEQAAQQNQQQQRQQQQARQQAQANQQTKQQQKELKRQQQQQAQQNQRQQAAAQQQKIAARQQAEAAAAAEHARQKQAKRQAAASQQNQQAQQRAAKQQQKQQQRAAAATQAQNAKQARKAEKRQNAGKPPEKPNHKPPQ